MMLAPHSARRVETRRQNERDGAVLRCSVAAATPSQLRRSSAARTMSGRRGIGRSSPSGKFGTFGQTQGHTTQDTRHNLVFSNYSPYPYPG